MIGVLGLAKLVNNSKSKTVKDSATERLHNMVPTFFEFVNCGQREYSWFAGQ